MIEIEIDGKTVQAKEGEMIIQASDNAGIYIPRFCYHKKLTVAANCRMCLVEVEKAPKTLPACATPVAPGMKIFTQSEKTLTSQKAVMEFLLINHPLDCPVCDQGGECELQDLAMGYGKGISRYNQGKRSVKDKNLGPLIASDMTRCIQCTRCVRFGNELAGLPELGAVNRGENLEITTFVEKSISSEISGNIIDLCPVGALTSKPFRFNARAWELSQHESIAPHDCLGSNIYIHTRGREFTPVREILRVVPRENERINETWLSDRDRFSYAAVNSEERTTQPLIKKQGEWIEVDWETALDEVADRLQNVIRTEGAEQIGALISPSSTVEECYLLQKILREVGCHNIDHRLQQSDFSHQDSASLAPIYDFELAELETLDTILLVGSDIRREQPLANLRLKKAVRNNCKVYAINPVAYDSSFDLAGQTIVAGHDFVKMLAGVLNALADAKTDKPTSEQQALAEKLKAGVTVGIILGAYALNHAQAATVYALIHQISQTVSGKVICLTPGANSAGAWLAGAIPHRKEAGEKVSKSGLNAMEMLRKSLQTYLLFQVEPELDCANSEAALQNLKQAKTVVMFSSYRSARMMEYADIILPLAAFGEVSGTYVNVMGQWQSPQAASLPAAAAREGWRVLLEVAQRLELKNFNFEMVEEIRHHLQNRVQNQASELMLPSVVNIEETQNSVIHRIMEWPMYCIDAMVRRSKPLQSAQTDDVMSIRVNSKLAEQLNLKHGMMVKVRQQDTQLMMPLSVDNRVADNHAVIAAGMELTAGFGDALSPVYISE